MTAESPEEGGDRIFTGDLTHTVAAFGRGAQVIYHQAVTAAEEARAREDFEKEKLAHAVGRLMEGLEKSISVQPSTGGSPYRYLAPFDISDARLFCSRDAFLDELGRRVSGRDIRSCLLVLQGDTGVGKTSLLRAGMVPAIVAAEHLPILVHLPGSDSITDTVKQSLLPDLHTTPLLQQASLQSFAESVTSIMSPGSRLFLILDQFEAFFECSPATREEFLRQLAQCLYDEDSRVHWVLSIRSSHYPRLSEFQAIGLQPFANTAALPPLDRLGAQAALEEPANQAGLSFEGGLVGSILEDLGGESVDPSALQLVGHTLASSLQPGETQVRRELYEGLRKVEGILQDHLDLVLERSMPRELREPAWRILNVLIEEPILPEALFDRVVEDGVPQQQAKAVLTRLEAGRLVRQQGEEYKLASLTLLPRIREWRAARAAREQARLEAQRQLRSIRDSALRGALGGAFGFTLSFLVVYGEQVVDPSLLGYITAVRALPGAFAGMFLVLMVDLGRASYRGRQKMLRYVSGGLGGAGGFALALLFNALLRSMPLSGLGLAALGGALWGAAAGLGAVWMLDSQRQPWAGIFVASIASALVLLIADVVLGGVFGTSAPPLSIFLAGVALPFFVLASSLLGRREFS